MKLIDEIKDSIPLFILFAGIGISTSAIFNTGLFRGIALTLGLGLSGATVPYILKYFPVLKRSTKNNRRNPVDQTRDILEIKQISALLPSIYSILTSYKRADTSDAARKELDGDISKFLENFDTSIDDLKRRIDEADKTSREDRSAP